MNSTNEFDRHDRIGSDSDLRDLFRRTAPEFGGVDAAALLERARFEHARRQSAGSKLRLAVAAVVLVGIGAAGAWWATRINRPVLEREIETRILAAVEARVERRLAEFERETEERSRGMQLVGLKDLATLLRREFQPQIDRLIRALGQERTLALATFSKE